MVLYRKYRPQSFKELVGQNHIKVPLLASLKSGKISHSYLFSGPRGSGKTSTARIFAKAINCQQIKNLPLLTGRQNPKPNIQFGEPCNKCDSCLAITQGQHLDLVEIDAASNRGIDEIRELREKIKLSPSAGRFKVYIIDEAHMLTRDAFNALLKTLEEPPSHAVFILATTEPQKIPPTVLSRTTHFQFKMPSAREIKEKLLSITRAENWSLESGALEEIAKAASGAFRDAEVLLEKIALVNQKASRETVQDILGKVALAESVKLLTLLENGKGREALIWLSDYLNSGGDVRVICESILETLRKILLFKAGAQQVLEPFSEEEKQTLDYLSKIMSRDRLVQLVGLFNKAIQDLKESTIPQLPLEMAIVEASLDNMGEIERPFRAREEESGRVAAAPSLKEDEWQLGGEGLREKLGEKDNKSAVNDDDKSGKSDTKILKKIESSWDKVLKNVKVANSSLVHFLKGAKPLDFDNGLLTLEFILPFYKQKAEERKYREAIEESLEKIAGVPVRFKGVVSKTRKQFTRETRKQPHPPVNEEVDPVEVFGKLE